MAAADLLTHESQAPAVVRVQPALYLLHGDVSEIAAGLRAGQAVELTGKISWCLCATRANAAIILTTLHQEYGLRPSVQFERRAGFYFLLFSPEVCCD